MRDADQRRLVDALAFALHAHGEQTRKGSAIPYASHLLQVAGLVLEAGGDTAQATAGLLHDCLEDCDSVDAAALRTRFGDEVARIVEACSDVLAGDRSDAKSEWGLRKSTYLARLRGSDARVRLVAGCDKLHNLRSLVADLRAHGPATLDRFTPSPARTRGYYEAAFAALGDALPDPQHREFAVLLEALRSFVPDSEVPAPER